MYKAKKQNPNGILSVPCSVYEQIIQKEQELEDELNNLEHQTIIENHQNRVNDYQEEREALKRQIKIQ